ncbi:L-ascorbate metabolism protein UlaG, beta-lactamase superfamily [Paenibacillus algorifonticola]|uniref:L-ascorbate metabolism protein UlaG, beta-lactamase superfamily n=1 Tax=Paenibacillus algorifonticola TaxID=684063 RepID=A0A1I2A682_9BACL|nr:MBL fold metallo-hydrolase [Paenibacillus algorifonticola]SFE39239.1 L-ascorbate metabolism protein UlaG, beta-lactamase superfamily [Paenibacillus algorifonticola]
MLTAIIVLATLLLAIVLVLKFYPALGGVLTKEQLAAFSRSAHYRDGKFKNLSTTVMDNSASSIFSMLRDYMRTNPNRRPQAKLPLQQLQFGRDDKGEQARVTWFGHSAMLLELDGKHILLDPMFGQAPSPFPFFGNKRYSGKLPFEIAELPQIDAVVLSHDHYDHLDYDSILKLKNKVRRFIVPLGVGSHLERWGVEKSIITEHDWWEELEFEGLRLAAAPAQHFSGRNLNNRDSTLWCSWVITGRAANIYFSGDSGYGAHFKEIGEKYGPFDLTLMECGQYDPRWSSIHMMPEETVQAHVDVKGKTLLPIHWGAFTLSFHDWNDPVERVTKAAKQLNVQVATPIIGEPVSVGAGRPPSSIWWKTAQ